MKPAEDDVRQAVHLGALVCGPDEHPDRRRDQADDAQNGEGDAEKCHQPASPGGRQPTYCFESRREAEARFKQASRKSHHDQSDWRRWNAVVLLSAQHLALSAHTSRSRYFTDDCPGLAVHSELDYSKQ